MILVTLIIAFVLWAVGVEFIRRSCARYFYEDDDWVAPLVFIFTVAMWTVIIGIPTAIVVLVLFLIFS